MYAHRDKATVQYTARYARARPRMGVIVRLAFTHRARAGALRQVVSALTHT